MSFNNYWKYVRHQSGKWQTSFWTEATYCGREIIKRWNSNINVTWNKRKISLWGLFFKTQIIIEISSDISRLEILALRNKRFAPIADKLNCIPQQFQFESLAFSHPLPGQSNIPQTKYKVRSTRIIKLYPRQGATKCAKRKEFAFLSRDTRSLINKMHILKELRMSRRQASSAIVSSLASRPSPLLILPFCRVLT